MTSNGYSSHTDDAANVVTYTATPVTPTATPTLTSGSDRTLLERSDVAASIDLSELCHRY